jgi:apolipoprotein N-acyltransferase
VAAALPTRAVEVTDPLEPVRVRTSRARTGSLHRGLRRASYAPVMAAPTAAPHARRLPAGVRTALVRAAAPAASATGGVLLYLSFPPRTLWWLAPLGFALFGAAVRGRGAKGGFSLGLLFGLGFLLPLLEWTGTYVGPVPWLALSAFEALFCAVAGAGLAAVSRLPAAPLFGAAVWVACEAARGRLPFGGFPWGKVGFGQPDGPMLPLVALGGSSLLSFAVVVTGLGLAELARRAITTRAALLAPALAAVLAPLAGLASTPLLAGADSGESITAAVVQGNVPRAGLDFNAQRRAVLDNHANRTRQLATDVTAGRAPQLDLVVWPENASDIDPLRNADASAVINRAADDVGVPILVGAVLRPDDETVENAILRWEPGVGSTGKYVKRRIQPFGEYIPLRRVARLVSSDVDRVRRDMVRGDQVGVFDVAGTRVAVATCYEVAFDDVVTDAVQAGGTLIVVPTNNATFGFTEMTYQQLAMDRVRAVEHGRTVVVAATSGVSAIVRPDGSVSQRTGLFTPAALVERVPLRSATTLSDRLGAWPQWIMVGAGLAALVAGIAIRRRGHVRSGTGARAPRGGDG